MKPLRDLKYIDRLNKMPCAYCPHEVATAHHYPTRASGGSDHHTVPLCKRCHRQWLTGGTIGELSPHQTQKWLQARQIELLSKLVQELEEKLGRAAPCKLCRGEHEILYLVERPGSLPGNQMIPCPRCRPQEKG